MLSLGPEEFERAVRAQYNVLEYLSVKEKNSIEISLFFFFKQK